MADQPRPTGIIVCGLVAPFVVFALGVGHRQIDARDASDAPTTLELALSERACSAIQPVRAGATDPHGDCVSARLASLREDFGRDLSRLSSADRKRIDVACGRLRAFERREPYLDCLDNQLAAVSLKQNHGSHATTPDAAVASALTDPSPAAEAPPAPAPAPRLSAMTIGAGVGALAVLVVPFFALRSRRAAPAAKCRVCGAAVAHSDLCVACRHQAAEQRRHADEEQARKDNTLDEQERRLHDEQEQREQMARAAEDARAREQELVRQREAAAVHSTEPSTEHVEAPHDTIAAPVEIASEPIGIDPAQEQQVDGHEFDPYAVLGVPPDASPEAIGAAYKESKTKYDPELVSFLGDETQAHFRARAEAIERAYQVLTEAHS